MTASAPIDPDEARRAERHAKERRIAIAAAEIAEMHKRYGGGYEYPWETTLTDEETHDERCN
jgi:hypothetical protein